MKGNWNFRKESAASPDDLDLKTRPNCIRPETDWLQEVAPQGRADDRLWLSLQLSVQRAQELCDAFARSQLSGRFGELITGGALLPPASYAALRIAIATARHAPWPGPDPMDQMLGTDLLVPPGAYDALRQLVDPGKLEISDAGLALDGSVDTLRLDPDFGPKSAALKGDIPCSPVIIAIIDDGIGIANHRFRAAQTATRVEHFLDLSLIGTATAAGAADELLGWSWTASDINKLLVRYPDNEERVYRALGLIDTKLAGRQPLRLAVSHGTHTLDTAAGYDWQPDNAARADRPILAVQLPTPAAEHRSDVWLPQSLKRGLDWILVKADALSARLTGGQSRLPLVVNCSFGSMVGPMDGWSDVERRITQFVRTYRDGGPPELCTVVMPAGNSLNFRAAGRVDVYKERVSLPWRVLPDDKTPSFVQIWLPETGIATQQVRVALRPPGESEAERFSVLDKALDWTVGGAVCARLYHQSWARPENKRRESVTIAIRATEDDGAPVPQPVVPAGLWHIDIEPAGDLPQSLKADLHVHRDDVAMFARRKGRQSYFDDPDYQPVEMAGDLPAADAPLPRPNAHPFVRTQGTLNAYGFGEGTLLVAGYRYSDDQPAAYSSSGADYMERRATDSQGNRLKGPDLAAVTEESPMLPGILRTGTYSGSVARLNGTSVAAPLAVRALADAIAGGGSVNTLKAALNPGSSQGVVGKGQAPPPKADDPRVGAGRLNFTPSHRGAD